MKTILAIFLFVVNASFAQSNLIQAKNLFGHGNFEQAKSLVEDEIKKDPKNGEAWFWLGKINSKEGDIVKARLNYQKALTAGYDDFKIYNNIANTYWEEKKYDSAIVYFDKILEKDKTKFMVYTNRGLAYLDSQRIPQAIDDFNRSISLNDKDAETYVNRGVAYSWSGQPELALQDYKRAMKCDKSNYLSYANSAKVYDKLGKKVKAEEMRKKAKMLNPAYSEEKLLQN